MAVRTKVKPILPQTGLGMLFAMWKCTVDIAVEENGVEKIFYKLLEGYWKEDDELRIKNEATGKACTASEFLNYLSRIPKPQGITRIDADKYTGFTVTKDEIILPWTLVDYTLALTTIQCYRFLSMFIHDEKISKVVSLTFTKKVHNKKGGSKIKGVTDNEFGLLEAIAVAGPELDDKDLSVMLALAPGGQNCLSISDFSVSVREVIGELLKEEVENNQLRQNKFDEQEDYGNEADKKLGESLGWDSKTRYSLGSFLLTRRLNIAKIDYYADNIDNIMSLYSVIRNLCPEYYAQMAYELAIFNQCITKFCEFIPDKYITEEMITNLDFGLEAFCSGPLMSMYIYESGDPQAEEFKSPKLDSSTTGLYNNYRTIDINTNNNKDKCKITNTDAICRVIQERLFITTGIYYRNDQIIKHLLDYEFFIVEQCLGNDIPGLIIRRGDCTYTKSIIDHINKADVKLDDYKTYVKNPKDLTDNNYLFDPYRQNELYHLESIPKPGGFLDMYNRGLFARMCVNEIHRREVTFGRYLTQQEIDDIEFMIPDLYEDNRSIWMFSPNLARQLSMSNYKLIFDYMTGREVKSSAEAYEEAYDYVTSNKEKQKETVNAESHENIKEENNLVDTQVLIDTYENQINDFKKQNDELVAEIQQYKTTLQDFINANEEYEQAYNELASRLTELENEKQSSIQFGKDRLQEKYSELEQENQNLQDLVEYLTTELYGNDSSDETVETEDNEDEIDKLYQDAIEFFKPYKLVIAGSREGWDDMFKGLNYKKVLDAKSAKLHRGDYPVGDLLLINTKFMGHGTLWKLQKECVRNSNCIATTAATNAKVFLIQCAKHFENTNIDDLIGIIQ